MVEFAYPDIIGFAKFFLSSQAAPRGMVLRSVRMDHRCLNVFDDGGLRKPVREVENNNVCLRLPGDQSFNDQVGNF